MFFCWTGIPLTLFSRKVVHFNNALIVKGFVFILKLFEILAIFFHKRQNKFVQTKIYFKFALA
jgi:hypothetical protein